MEFRKQIQMWWKTLTLCEGDAFHLVPRIIRAVHGSSFKGTVGDKREFG